MRVALLLYAAVVASTIQQAPARDVAIQPTIGTGSVSGTVVSDESPARPIARAIVSLSGSGLIPSRGAISDDSGRFTLKGLPAGRFTLTVSRSAFITSAYGAKRPGRPGTPIVVGDGEAVTGLTLRLWRGAAIAGVLRDENGKPRENIVVSAIPTRTAAGSTMPTLSNNGVRTNDLGEFRIFGLEPGPYVLTAQPASGGNLQMIAPGDAAVEAALDALRRRAAGSTPLPSGPAAAPRSFDYATVFFPGTTQISQATLITLAAGDERVDLNFALQRVTTSTIEGVVLRPDGSPAGGARLQMKTAAPPETFSSLPKVQLNAAAGADGRFTIPQVTPGDYVLLARAPEQPPQPVSRAGSDAIMVSPAGVGGGPSLWALTSLSIAGSDIGNVTMSLQPGGVVAGSIVFDGAGSKPADLSRVQLVLEDPDLRSLKPGTPITTITFSGPAFAKADGSFQMSGLAPGTFRMFVGRGNIPANWSLRSVMAGDRDLLDGLVEMALGATTTGVVVTFSERRTELSGALQTPTGAPASDVFVIAYSADRKFWGPVSRRVAAVRPGVDGKFAISDLPPGDYLISAVTDVDQGEWQDPAFLEKLVTASVKVKIGEGEKVVQNLRLGGG